ncbi:hypothetical protein [Lyngbya sp. CCY1209]|uniref:hypothetical protein n=1 Tax=Lyngbya sp. CCY1209 TaxID=2886103 RepID=UPI002D20B09F|nr:hypothetical protein [Lyngbya sp. CCY1209]MEB3884429.1 hypothetical protein [Lyngbya sp. CCY1209]
MKLKVIENFDGHFTLEPEAESLLFELLNGETFLHQISRQIGGDRVEFTGQLFQPVPYSTNTPKGMPPEFEPYHQSEDHVIVNVPPNYMFQAKIFNPSRLCAIYRRL